MAATTHPEFDMNTEGVDVAKAFADGLRGKTILVTGVNRGGIGFSTSHALASQSPARIILAGRNHSRVKECIDALKADFPNVDYRFLEINLSIRESVREAAKEVLSWSDVPTIDIVINSAGIMGIPERTLTKEGMEIHFATNHIGHWLFTCLIMPKLIKAAEGKPKGSVRIVNVSSGSPTISALRWSDMNFETKNKDLPEEEQPNYEYFKAFGYNPDDGKETAYVPLDGYNRSKVANVLFGIGANKRLFDKYGILSVGVHPGVIPTDLGRNFPQEVLDAVASMRKLGFFTYKTLGAGASTSLVAALDPKLANGVGETHEGSENYGAYLLDCQVSTAANPLAVSSEHAERLWEFSEKSVGQKFSW
ncbi:hypothetical protein FDECE_8023 [Fusarium decemcellulare]|nr:hypothetical protein FDECE_8023 [Fusarium decemcellulare]